MIRIIIFNKLRDAILKTFKKESENIYSLFEELKTNPQKGKVLGHVGSMSIRELRYKSFRFSFIIDGHKLYLFGKGELEELLIRFVRMSKKHDQQRTIDELRRILGMVGEDGLE